MEGVDGFFRFIEMKRSGKSDEDILGDLFHEAEMDLSIRAGKIQAIIQRALEARRADGERFAKEIEEAEDITAPAKARIVAAKKAHETLHAQITEVEELIKGLKITMETSERRKDLLSRKLRFITLKLNALTEDPKWMKPGTLEELRLKGKEYGDSSSRS